MTTLKDLAAGFAAIAICITGLSLTGCEQEGPMERTGERADDALDDVNEGIEDAGDELDDALDN